MNSFQSYFLIFVLFIAMSSPLAASSGSLVVNSGSLVASSGSQWMTDIDAALALAKKTNKPVLVDFSGSDWCKWCIQLDEEVFEKSEFKIWAKKNIIMCLIDSPRDKSILSEEQYKKNRETTKRYEVKGYPTVLLLGKDGKVFGKTGYKRGGPKSYIAHLEELISYKDWAKNLAAIDKLKTNEQIKLASYLLNNKINALDDDAGTKVATILFTKIADNKSVDKSKAATLLALNESKSELKASALKWMKDRAKEGDNRPYSVFLFMQNSIEFTVLGQIIQDEKGNVLSSKDVKKRAEAVLAGIRELEKYMNEPVMKQQVATRKVLCLASIGKKEQSLKLADSLFTGAPNSEAMTKQLKDYIKSIK